LKPLSLGDLKMRSYPQQEAVKFRNNASEEVVRGLGVSVLDPSPVSGPLLAVAAAPKGLHRAALHLLDLARPAFLDSSLTDGHGGRYSFFTADPFLVLRSRGRRVELIGPAGRAVTEEDPWVLLQLLLRRYPVDRVAGLPLFLGGAVGYFGYDLGRTLEPLPATAADEGLPELDVGFYDWVLAADHLSGESWIVATGLPTGQEADARARVAGIQERLNDTPSSSSNAASLNAPRLLSNLRRVDYLQAIERAREYIAAGDIFQVNLSHRLEGEWDGAAWPLYERLRTASPVSYGAYLDLGDVKVLSASPERFLKLDGRWIETRPIKGTRPRGVTLNEDRMLGAELLTSEKDRAENLMIVDLLRNDVGKVSCIGSVGVPKLFDLERHASVWHLVSTVRGELRPGLDAVDLLRACFPGGSVTGCPKIRAMEIIEELEPVRRGVYCGAIGYLSFTGDMDTNIVIRTLVLRDGRIDLQVGGAVTYDSDPESEYVETLAKGRALLGALGAKLEEW
jgi:para-aminobenzoate synthetase component I